MKEGYTQKDEWNYSGSVCRIPVMIYLIGGAPRVGKSTISKIIATSEHVNLVSTDTLCSRVSESLPAEERKTRFPLPGFSGTASENILTPEQRVALSIVSAQSLETEIDRLISEAVEKNKSLVIEGVHLLPAHVGLLLAQYEKDKIRAIFLGSVHVDRVVDGIMKNTSPDNWMRESDPDVIRQVAEFVVAFSHYLQTESDRHHLVYQERTEDFESDQKILLRQLLA